MGQVVLIGGPIEVQGVVGDMRYVGEEGLVPAVVEAEVMNLTLAAGPVQNITADSVWILEEGSVKVVEDVMAQTVGEAMDRALLEVMDQSVVAVSSQVVTADLIHIMGLLVEYVWRTEDGAEVGIWCRSLKVGHILGAHES
jgi:uncharacterized protein YabE (DUF348 family)